LSYNSSSWYGNVDAKFTGKSYSTLVNDESVDANTLVNLTVGYHFANTGFFKNPSIQLNVSNLFNEDYVRINSGSGSQFTTRALTSATLGAGSSPAYFVGAPRFSAVTFRSDF
jgi:iron complex outermembrane receptor protein